MPSILDDALNKTVGQYFDAGNLISDTVTIKIGTRTYTGWKSVTINQDLNALSSSFNIGVSDKWRQSSEPWPFRPGEQVRVYAGADSVMNGYIDILESSVSNEDRQISVSGRDKTSDIIDSAAIATRSSYRNISLLNLAKIYLSDINIAVTSDTPDALTPISKVVVEQGETIFDLLGRQAKELGVLLSSTPDGSLLITDRRGIVDTKITDATKKSGSKVAAASGQAEFSLQQGVNVLTASASFDETNRFQTYLVKSQIEGNDHVNAKDSTTINGVAFDRGVNRPRTKYIIAEKSMTNKSAKKRAEWMANVHAVGAVTVEITVQGWKDATGKLWQTNKIISTDLRFIGISPQMMLIIGLSRNQSSEGTKTTLKLTRLDGYQAQPEQAEDPKKDVGWDNSIYGPTAKKVADALGFTGK